MNSETQLPGNLPPGATLDSMLTLEQWATWQHMSPLTARRYVADLRRKGIVRSAKRTAKSLIHPRTFLFHQGPKFKEALTQ